MPALGKSMSHPGWLSPLPTSPGALASVQEGEHSGAGSAVGQGLLWGRTWGMAGSPQLGFQCQTLSHPHTIMSSHFLLPLCKEDSGEQGGLTGAHGALMLFCPREQWRAAAWASPSFVLLC